MAGSSYPDWPRFPDESGLLPAIAQDDETGRVLMLAWMNEASFRETLDTGRAVYFSRSRGALWRKGETSGHVQQVQSVWWDCDADAILLRVRQTGVACHLGFASCFFNRWTPEGGQVEDRSQSSLVQQRWKQKELPMSDFDAALNELHLELPAPAKPMGAYVPLVVVGEWAYVSGHGPLQSDGQLITGRVGHDLTVEQGVAAARQTGLAILASLQSQLGTLNRIQRLVKLFGMVSCVPEFDQQPKVINGCSELFAQVFGADAGVAARSAVGVAALPAGMAVEIEAIFQLRESGT